MTARAVAVLARQAAVAAAAAGGGAAAAGAAEDADEESSGEDQPRADGVEELRGIEVRGALRVSLED